jgi:hypothetical protein
MDAGMISECYGGSICFIVCDMGASSNELCAMNDMNAVFKRTRGEGASMPTAETLQERQKAGDTSHDSPSCSRCGIRWTRLVLAIGTSTQ